jgi:hypothetical protein
MLNNTLTEDWCDNYWFSNHFCKHRLKNNLPFLVKNDTNFVRQNTGFTAKGRPPKVSVTQKDLARNFTRFASSFDPLKPNQTHYGVTPKASGFKRFSPDDDSIN